MDLGENCWTVALGQCVKHGLTDFISYLANQGAASKGYAWVVSSEEERDVLLGLGLIMGAKLNVFHVPLWEQNDIQATQLLPSAFYKIYLYDFADVVHNLI